MLAQHLLCVGSLVVESNIRANLLHDFDLLFGSGGRDDFQVGRDDLSILYDESIPVP